MRKLLLLSAVINALLAGWILVACKDPSGGRGSSPPVATVDAAEQPGRRAALRRSYRGGGASLAGYYRMLRARGFSHDETRIPLAGWLTRRRALQPASMRSYWEAGYAPRRGRQAPGGELAAQLRAAVLAIHGPEVAFDPAFATLFFPLGAGFEFLDSATQIAVVESAPDSATAGDWLSLLSDEQRFEHSLRFSPPAAALRALDLDEADFRATFRLLERALAADSSMAVRSGATRALRRSLGVERARSLLANFDPLAGVVRRLLAAAGADSNTIELTYGIVARSREEMQDLLERTAIPSGGATDEVGRALSQLRQAEAGQLESLLGADLGQRLSAALARFEPDEVPAACRVAGQPVKGTTTLHREGGNDG